MSQLKVAHFAAFGPNRSGQYATVHDLILAERKQGVDAQFIDMNPCDCCHQNLGRVDREHAGIKTVNKNWAKEADILVRHSLIPPEYEQLNKPIILCLHGRPENSFLLEHYKKTPVFSLLHDLYTDDRYFAFITFWKEFLPHWEYMIPTGKLFYVPSMVDQEKFSCEGKKFEFNPNAKPNIMVADMWREDTTPFNVIIAAAQFIKEYEPEGRIHAFGLPAKQVHPAQILAHRLNIHKVWGKGYVLQDNIQEMYRAADLLVTPHNMGTRVIREALSCGCPVVAGSGAEKYTPYTASARDISGFTTAIKRCYDDIKLHGQSIRDTARKKAEGHFNLEQAGQAMCQVFEHVQNQKKHQISISKTFNEDITFATYVFGNDYIDYLNVLVQSIDKTYGGKAKIIVYYDDIDKGFIEDILKVFPYVKIVKYECVSGKGDYEYRSALKSIVWCDILKQNPEAKNLVLLDSDTIVLKQMGKFFGNDFDIGYCFKLPDDENPNWPINAGIMLCKNNEKSISFLTEWSILTKLHLKDQLHKNDGYLLWGGGDQVSLGFMLGTRKLHDYKKLIIRDGVKLQGFPCMFFNESRSMTPTNETHILHLKGKSWRDVLTTGRFSIRRPREYSESIYKMWSNLLKEWRDKRYKQCNKWCPKFELEYWNSAKRIEKDFIKDVQDLYEIFNVEGVVNSFSTKPSTIVDVGGGAYGGALRFCSFGEQKILFDYLANEFISMGHLPKDIKIIQGDFRHITLPNNYADVVFAWEVLDHALTNEHFKQGQKELIRILKPQGVLFFNQPLLNLPKPGHIIIKTKDEICLGFLELITLRETIITRKKGRNELCLTLQKPKN